MKDKGKKPRYKRCLTCKSHYKDVGPHTEEKGCWICEYPKYKGYEPKEK